MTQSTTLALRDDARLEENLQWLMRAAANAPHTQRNHHRMELGLLMILKQERVKTMENNLMNKTKKESQS